MVWMRDMTEFVTLLVTLDIAFVYVEVQALMPQWDKCLMSLVTMLRSGVYHLLHMYNVYTRVRIKSGVRMFVTLFFKLLCS